MNFRRHMMYLAKRIRKMRAKLADIDQQVVLFLVGVLLVGCVLGGLIVGSVERSRARHERDQLEAQLQERTDQEVTKLKNELEEALSHKTVEIPWYLTLVNAEHPMEKDYDLELTEVADGYQVDSRIVKATKKMLRDAEKAGLNIIVCSAYRSVKRQEQVFNESVKDRLNQGMNYWDAFQDTRMSVAEPGTSEHAMGLALDLISNQYAELDKKQEKTKEAKWLAENCSKYGFILRYPPSKTNITGIIYEPWHYRYVGVEDATKIMDLGITLEEYLAQYYGK